MTRQRALCGAMLAASLVFAGCASDSQSADNKSGGGLLGGLMASKKPVTVPDGTPIKVVLDQAIASDQNRNGDRFDASVAEDVVLNNKTIIPKGARVTGTVVEARESGRLKGVALLRLALSEVQVEGKDYEVRTSTVSFKGPNHKTRNTAMIGGGAGAGALIGAIAGGGKGAAIGAGIGAGAGTAGAAATGKKDITLRAETPLTFRLSQDVTVEVKQ